MRHIVFDVETTGTDPQRGDRIVEIGAVELLDYLPTGKEFHSLINPERLIPADAQRVHGISDADVANSPKFSDSEIVDALLDFIGDAPLVAHNAEFDRGFINMELGRLGKPLIPQSQCIDTLQIARKKFPGAPASLDALCKRFDISLDVRKDRHGALIDSQLLASVFLELNGGAERRLDLYQEAQETSKDGVLFAAQKPSYPPRPRQLSPRLTAAEKAAHQQFVGQLAGGGLWG